MLTQGRNKDSYCICNLYSYFPKCVTRNELLAIIKFIHHFRYQLQTVYLTIHDLLIMAAEDLAAI